MTRFAQADDGVALAYEVAGEGPTILLIHGFAASRAMTWRNTGWIDWLVRAGRTTIAMDCRGHGQSAKPHTPESYDDLRMAADVVAVLDALAIPVADIMGYSMGGYVAINLVQQAPERIGRVIVAGVGETYFRFWSERSERIAQGLLAEDPAAITDPLAREFRSFAEKAGNDLVALAACMRRQRHLLSEEELGRLNHPVLVVCGEEDPIAGSPEPLARFLGGGQALTIPKRNHHSTVGDRLYKEAVKDFLGSAPGGVAAVSINRRSAPGT